MDQHLNAPRYSRVSDRHHLRALRPARDGHPYLVMILVCWTLWVLCSMIWSDSTLVALLPYLGFPIVLFGGVFIGRWLSRLTAGMILPVALAAVAGVVLLAVPFYANAQAAWGLQLLALAGLLSLEAPTSAGRGSRGEWSVVALGMLALGAILLTARAQATSLLVIPFGLIGLCTVVAKLEPKRSVVGIVGLSTVGAAAATVIGLGSLHAWPAPMNAGNSLSGARHRLWADALGLWRTHPVTGAGPGSFLISSDLAGSNPTLERAHSSILQVGAELGTIGAVLFLAILVAGAAVALKGSKPAALIGVSAWSALGIHSMIDHLYSFPLVTLTAGIVLGFAGRVRPQDSKETVYEVGERTVLGPPYLNH